MISLPETRFQAFIIHLAGSFLLFLLLANVIFWLWYPDYLFWSAGGVRGIYLLLGVNVTAGPILTLLIYNKSKKRIKFNMCAILLIQALCVGGGMWALWYEKPLAIVYHDGIFYSPTRQDYLTEESTELSEKLSLFGRPQWYTIDNSNFNAVVASMSAAIAGNKAYLETELYVPFSPRTASLSKGGVPLDKALKVDLLPQVFLLRVKKRSKLTTLRVYPFSNAFQSGILVIDSATGKVISHYYR